MNARVTTARPPFFMSAAARRTAGRRLSLILVTLVLATQVGVRTAAAGAQPARPLVLASAGTRAVGHVVARPAGAAMPRLSAAPHIALQPDALAPGLRGRLRPHPLVPHGRLRLRPPVPHGRPWPMSTGHNRPNATSCITTITVDTTAMDIDGNTSSPNSINGNPGPDGTISFQEAINAINNGGLGEICVVFSLPGGQNVVQIPEEDIYEPNITINGDNGSGAPGVALEPAPGAVGLVARNRGVVIEHVATTGILLDGVSGSDGLILDNYIGTDITGLQFGPGNDNGIEIANGAAYTYIAGNVIAGNQDSSFPSADVCGIDSYGGSQLATIVDNLIGVNAAGQPLGNDIGICIGSGPGSSQDRENVIGGTCQPGVCTGAGNTISGNRSAGVIIDGAGANTVQGNY